MENGNSIGEILEIVQFIKDNAASKQDLAGMVTKQDLAAVESRLDQKIEGVRSELVEFKNFVTTQLDAQNVILQRLDQERVFTLERVRVLEEDVKQIKLKLAIV